MRKIALALGIVAVLGIGAFVFVYLPSRDNKEAPGQQALKADTRSYSAGGYALDLDGTAVGYVNPAEGGAAVGDVVVSGAGKNIGSIKYEEMMVGAGLSMENAFYQWIKDSWAGNSPGKNGALAALTFDKKVQSQRDFKNALLTETTFPAFDASSKDASLLTVKFLPESTSLIQGAGAPYGGKLDATKSKQWLSSNFRLTVDNLDATKVNRIEPFSVKHKVAGDTSGADRFAAKTPVGTEFSNLKIVMSADSAQTWYAWHDSFVVKGNQNEKGGKLVFLSSNLQTELGFVQFYNMGIIRIAPMAAAAGTDAIARVVADLYVERMEFQFGSATKS